MQPQQNQIPPVKPKKDYGKIFVLVICGAIAGGFIGWLAGTIGVVSLSPSSGTGIGSAIGGVAGLAFSIRQLVKNK